MAVAPLLPLRGTLAARTTRNEQYAQAGPQQRAKEHRCFRRAVHARTQGDGRGVRSWPVPGRRRRIVATKEQRREGTARLFMLWRRRSRNNSSSSSIVSERAAKDASPLSQPSRRRCFHRKERTPPGAADCYDLLRERIASSCSCVSVAEGRTRGVGTPGIFYCG